ncbi:hypothetical protein JXA56_01920 [Candidatus Micrarchaeota archaeon]|nr:hypothetical protein [Candidatus Micrarchaeota archaeon]
MDNFALRYPFTDDAKQVLEGAELNSRIIEMGFQRIKNALEGKAAGKIVYSENEIIEEIASYAAARMILGTLGNQFITGRFAVNESKIARAHLNKENQAAVNRIALHFGIITNENLLDIPTYLKYCPKSTPYRLINRRIVSGKVEISENEKLRLIEEGIRKHMEDIPRPNDPPEEIKKAGERLLLELPKHQTRITVKEGDHPPCIMKLFESVKKHQNLPHTARWYLATYLIGIGMEEDAIVEIYSGLPDFNEKITRYQISHAKKKGYRVPSCSTIMSYGLCCAVCRIGNPLKWHTISNIRKEGIR